MGSTAAMVGEAQSVPEPEPELEPEPEQEPTPDAVLPEPGMPPTEAHVVQALDQSVEAVGPPQVASAGADADADADVDADAHADEDGAPV